MICLVADIFASSISSTFSYTTSVSDIEWRNVEESNILSAKPRPPVRFSIRELNPKLFREQKNDLWKRMEKTVAWKELVTTISAFFIKPKNSFGPAFIIRKTKCFDFWERNVLFPKTKRSFFRTPTPLPCPFPLNFSLLIITKKFGNLAKNRYICIV